MIHLYAAYRWRLARALARGELDVLTYARLVVALRRQWRQLRSN